MDDIMEEGREASLFFDGKQGLMGVANRKRFAEYWKESENKYPICFVLRGGSGMIHDAHLSHALQSATQRETCAK